MTRTARFIQPNGYYHIISRSLNDTWVFRDTQDFSHFYQLLLTAKKKYPISIFHYIVMNTHFHLAIQTPSHDILSQNIAYLKWHYTLWMRKKYGWKGPAWKERFKSLLIENEDYLYACGMYIAYNPVRAGICKKPEEYPHSSYKKYHMGIEDPLIAPPAGDCHVLCDCHLLARQYDFQSPLSKRIFSDTQTIGSRLFIESHKQNACPQK